MHSLNLINKFIITQVLVHKKVISDTGEHDVCCFKNKIPLRVCLIAPLPPPYGGISNWTQMLKKYLCHSCIVELQILDIAPRWRSIDDKLIWKRVLGGGLQLIRDYVKYVMILIKSPDVVHLTTPGQFALIRDLIFLITSNILGIKSVYHIHFGRVPDILNYNTIEWKIMNLAIQVSTTKVALDENTRSIIAKKYPQKKIEKVPNGFDINEMPISNNNIIEKSVVYLGWVIKEKGIEDLCAAWEKYSMSDWSCYIVGPGSDNYKKKLLNRYQLKNIRFFDELGHDDAMCIVNRCSVFVLPSYTEGFPYVIVEAMSLGKAIVATSVGAIPEMLHGGCGVLVKPGDIDSLGSAIKSLCINEEMRKEMGDKAKEKAQNEYSIEKIVDKLIDIWK